MKKNWFQVEFYSDSEHRWVALFSHESSFESAEGKRRDWLGDTQSRVVRVIQTTEVVTESEATRLAGRSEP